MRVNLDAGQCLDQYGPAVNALTYVEQFVRRGDPDYVDSVTTTLAYLGYGVGLSTEQLGDRLRDLRMMLQRRAVEEVTE